MSEDGGIQRAVESFFTGLTVCESLQSILSTLLADDFSHECQLLTLEALGNEGLRRLFVYLDSEDSECRLTVAQLLCALMYKNEKAQIELCESRSFTPFGNKVVLNRFPIHLQEAIKQNPTILEEIRAIGTSYNDEYISSDGMYWSYPRFAPSDDLSLFDSIFPDPKQYLIGFIHDRTSLSVSSILSTSEEKRKVKKTKRVAQRVSPSNSFAASRKGTKKQIDKTTARKDTFEEILSAAGNRGKAKRTIKREEYELQANTHLHGDIKEINLASISSPLSSRVSPTSASSGKRSPRPFSSSGSHKSPSLPEYLISPRGKKATKKASPNHEKYFKLRKKKSQGNEILSSTAVSTVSTSAYESMVIGKQSKSPERGSVAFPKRSTLKGASSSSSKEKKISGSMVVGSSGAPSSASKMKRKYEKLLKKTFEAALSPRSSTAASTTLSIFSPKSLQKSLHKSTANSGVTSPLSMSSSIRGGSKQRPRRRSPDSSSLMMKMSVNGTATTPRKTTTSSSTAKKRRPKNEQSVERRKRKSQSLRLSFTDSANFQHGETMADNVPCGNKSHRSGSQTASNAVVAPSGSVSARNSSTHSSIPLSSSSTLKGKKLPRSSTSSRKQLQGQAQPSVVAAVKKSKGKQTSSSGKSSAGMPDLLAIKPPSGMSNSISDASRSIFSETKSPKGESSGLNGAYFSTTSGEHFFKGDCADISNSSFTSGDTNPFVEKDSLNL